MSTPPQRWLRMASTSANQPTPIGDRFAAYRPISCGLAAVVETGRHHRPWRRRRDDPGTASRQRQSVLA
jgi:hypothetical protein